MHLKDIGEVESAPLPDFIKDQLRTAFSGKKSNRTTNSSTNMEQASCNAPVPAYEGEKFDSSVRVDIYSTRKRKTDIDNISGKAALDGIVKSGLLRDDSPDEITAYQVHKAEISQEEKTTIIISII